LNSNLESYKHKKDLIEELDFYKSIILKKLDDGEINSASEKVNSAKILIDEHLDCFELEQQICEFDDLRDEINTELSKYRMLYERRFHNLLKERLNESNLENFSKLLAMLKNDIDHNLDKYNLMDISSSINNYFRFIKKIYEILSCYKVLNYHDASEKIFEFVRDIKSKDFPNLKVLISSIYKNLINNRLFEYSKECEKLTLSDLSKKMAINQERLLNFINFIKNQRVSPIKDYIPTTQEVIFKHPELENIKNL
jgi:hypothetical protein